jgi:hypothetical protein
MKGGEIYLIMENIQQWKYVTFESSASLTPQFARFARAYKITVIAALGSDFELVSWDRGHFYISAFFRNRLTGKLVYVSCSDVRFFPHAWYDNILIRTAEHERDFTGGANHYTPLDTLYEVAMRLSSGFGEDGYKEKIAELKKEPTQLALFQQEAESGAGCDE